MTLLSRCSTSCGLGSVLDRPRRFRDGKGRRRSDAAALRPARQAGVFAALLFLSGLAASGANPQTVLILNPFEQDVAPFGAVVSAFRATLAHESEVPIDTYVAPLDLGRFAQPEEVDPLVTLLESRLAKHPVDLVVPIGGTGVQFAYRYRERLFPDTPILIAAAEPRLLPPDALRANATYVVQAVNLPGVIEDILQMQPQTTNIVVVLGSSALERFWVNECRREFASFTNRLEFTYLNDLPVKEIVDRCASLPPRSFIFHGMFLTDAAGFSCERSEVIRRLHEVANAPIFGIFASEFGLGIIGGRLFQDSELGEQAARIALRILGGENPEMIPPRLLGDATPVFDWRELRRWGIPEARLPSGSIIQFRQPSFYEQYAWPMAGAVSFFALQAALIVGLLIQRGKRLRGEQEASLVADISSRFVNLAPSEVDSEIKDSLRRICAFLGIDLAVLWELSEADPGHFSLAHHYSVREETSLPRRISRDHFPWFEQQMQAGRVVKWSSPEELPKEAECDREHFRPFGTRSSLSLPLSVGGGTPMGVLGLNTLRKRRDWPDTLVKRMMVMSNVFANALARKRADQDLREAEARMTFAADAAEFGAWVWTLASNQVWGSPRWLSLFGFTPGDPIRFEDVVARIHPDDRAKVEREVRGALDRRSDYSGEFRVVLPGGMRWVLSRGRPYAGTNGHAARMLGAAMDITKRREGEEALRDLSGRLIRAHEEERARLARELHDDVSQRLALLAIDLGLEESRAGGLPAAERIRPVRDALASLSEDIHALSYRLHPSMLEDLGLAEALKAECERFSRQQAIPAEVQLHDVPAAIPPEPALCLFRVMQEALRNVARHAKAHRVEITVRFLDEGLQLAVLDDGIGFDSSTPPDHPSLGLASMRERVHLLAGEFTIESAPDQGATVLAWVPIAPEKS